LSQVAATGTSGGLVLSWRPGIDLECFVLNKNNITAWCYSDPPTSPWILSCVYGPSNRCDRRAFWDSFAAIGESFEASWLCIGDFNSILVQSDKQGGRPVAGSSHCPFKRFIDHFGMIDLGFAGNPFTWSNNRQGLENIKERLDRGLASPSWLHLHPEFSLIHLPAHNSDHNPISLNTNSTSCFLARPFRFEDFWTKDPSCGQVIAAAWQKFVPIHQDFCLPKKLENTKVALLKWNSLHFGNIHKQINDTLKLLDTTQKTAPSHSSFELEISLKVDLDNLLVKEESLWRSKSRESWLTCKDLNTKYFHLSTLIRRRSNAVNFLKLDSGVWVSSRTEIGDHFAAHFTNTFTSSNPSIEPELLNLFPPIISKEENALLSSIPTEEEILDALASLGSTKASGPDGFTALFFKKYWDIVREDVLQCIWLFFKSNFLQRIQNHSYIALVPKLSGSHTAHQFRPISLCNIVYKIISKLLANRLKVHMHKIISPFQSAFVPKRHIQDNTILAHELLHTFKSKRGKGGFMFLKMDMEKAFDRMEWPFILAILKQLGFSSIWIEWVRICITQASFSILLNGSPFGHFTPERGLRQGDPLSPFLFILGSEVLSRLLLREESIGSLKGLRIARNCAPINHLLFADDLLLFGKATLTEAASLKSCLDKYCRWSGQLINASKSSIRFSKNSNPATTTVIRNWFPFDENPPKSLYLGLPIFMENSKRRGFQGIIEKVNSRIDGWRAKTLSQAGRLVLIKSVAATIPSYAMGTFLIPNSCCKALDRAFKNFLWGFPPKKTRNLSLKAWDSICTPKALGGLGIRKMREVNLALISKLGWQLLNNSDTLWVSQLQGKYLNSTSFLSPSPISSSSWLWKGILKSKSIISKGACFRIQSQSSLPIWSSPWIPTIASFSPTPSPHLSHPPPQLLVSDLFIPDTTQSVSHWNIPLLLSLFDPISISEILKINLTSQQAKLIWTHSPKGDFTTKSAYHLISSHRYAPTDFPLTSTQWKIFWKINLNDRLKLFLWKIAWDIVPSKIRLNAVFPIPPSQLVCPLCKVEEDSLSHLFFSCFFARISWRLSPWPLDSLKWSSLTLPEWIKGIITPHKTFGILQRTHICSRFLQLYFVI
jgi:hypothetical protein